MQGYERRAWGFVVGTLFVGASIVVATTSPAPESPFDTAIQSVGIFYLAALKTLYEFALQTYLDGLVIHTVYTVAGIGAWTLAGVAASRYAFPRVSLPLGSLASLTLITAMFVGVLVWLFGWSPQFLLLGMLCTALVLVVSLIP